MKITHARHVRRRHGVAQPDHHPGPYGRGTHRPGRGQDGQPHGRPRRVPGRGGPEAPHRARPLQDRGAGKEDGPRRLLARRRGDEQRHRDVRDGLLGHRRQGPGPAGLQPARRSRARQGQGLRQRLVQGRAHARGVPRGREEGRGARVQGLEAGPVRPRPLRAGVRGEDAGRLARRGGQGRHRTGGRDPAGDARPLLPGHGHRDGPHAPALRPRLGRGAGAAGQPEGA